MGVNLPRMTRCCFCLTLRTGSLIIGYISIVMAILCIVTMCFLIYNFTIYLNSKKLETNPDHTPEELAKVAIGVYLSQAYYLLVYLYALTISTIMVVGVHTEKPKLVHVYVYSGFFLFGMELALVVISLVFMGILVTLPLLKWCMIHLFCLLVVRSMYLEMIERNRVPNFELQTLYSPQPLPTDPPPPYTTAS